MGPGIRKLIKDVIFRITVRLAWECDWFGSCVGRSQGLTQSNEPQLMQAASDLLLMGINLKQLRVVIEYDDDESNGQVMTSSAIAKTLHSAISQKAQVALFIAKRGIALLWFEEVLPSTLRIHKFPEDLKLLYPVVASDLVEILTLILSLIADQEDESHTPAQSPSFKSDRNLEPVKIIGKNGAMLTCFRDSDTEF